MSTGRPSSPSPSRIVRIGLVLASVSAVLGLASMTAMAILMVRSGRGLESYRTVWLVEGNWFGFLAFLGAALVASLAALAIRLYARRQEQRELHELAQKYGGHDDAA
jgi:hypothetical protein